MRKLIIVSLAFFGVVFTNGCGDNHGDLVVANSKEIDNKILLFGTEEYETKISKFNLSPDQAAEKIIEFKQSKAVVPESINYPGENHYVLIGDWYVFSRCEKTGINLSGFYVNGMTGKLEIKEFSKAAILKISQQKKMWGRAIAMEEGFIYRGQPEGKP